MRFDVVENQQFVIDGGRLAGSTRNVKRYGACPAAAWSALSSISLDLDVSV